MSDKEKEDDRLKHIVNELNIMNTSLQLVMSDLSHYIKELNEGEEDG